MTPLPSQLRIGPFVFSVEDWPSHEATAAGRFGECDRYNNVIRVRTDMPGDRVAETLLHEVFHAVWEVGCADDGDEEKIVSIFGKSMAQVWRDNPQLVKFVTGCLE